MTTFFVFPDNPSSSKLLGRLHVQECLTYPSGNPWLVTASTTSSLVSRGTKGDIAILGDSPLSENELAQALAKCSRLSELDVPRVDGAIVVAVMDREVRVQGAISGATRVYWALLDGIPVASNSASELARACGAPINQRRIALQLLDNAPTHLYGSETFWDGVHAVPPMCWLSLKESGAPQHIQWWHPPEASASIAEGAGRLRDAIHRGLEPNRFASETRSADLSGGLDSSSIVYALASLNRTVSTFHSSSANRWNDDSKWARRVADELGLKHTELGDFAEHSRAFDVSASPYNYEQLDSPPAWEASRGYLDRLAVELASIGSSSHYTGLGGDELFGYLPALTWSLWREKGTKSLPTIRRFQLLHRWPLPATIRALHSSRSLGQELENSKSHLRREIAEGPDESMAWSPRPTIAQWVTRDAEELIKTIIGEAAESNVRPFDADRGRHQMLESLQYQGHTVQQINQAYGNANLQWRAPFLDREVIEAAMSVKLSERFGANEAKPLLAAAMADTMPQDFFRRNGKGEYSFDVYAEFNDQRNELMNFFEESELVRQGFIDVDSLNSQIDGPVAKGDTVGRVERLVSLERWLRQASTGREADAHAALRGDLPSTPVGQDRK